MNDETDTLPEPGPLVLLAVVLECGLAFVALGLGWLFGQSPVADVVWGSQPLLLGTLATIPLLAGMFWCTRSQWRPLQTIRDICRQLIAPFFCRCTTLDLLLVAVAAGVGEEMLFRGIVQALGSAWFGPWIGLLLAAVLFGLVHPITPTYSILAGLAGLYFGLLWMASGNLLVPMVTHAVYDFVALVYVVKTFEQEETDPNP